MNHENTIKKSCLILSQGPVPTPEHTKVEGGGLRCWGLAKGIKANNADLQVTVAYHDSYRQENFTNHHEGIDIATWTNDTAADLLQAFDSVLVSYCMGELSVIVADSVSPTQQLVLDCYVPIYVEVSARDSDDLDREYAAFHTDIGRWAHVLRRGDLFLCASEPQRRYYQGVLSAVGRINPVTYGDELLLIVPYGIYREEPVAKEQPITKLVGDKVKKILWFGGIYPWFDLRNLVDAVKEINNKTPAKLIIVGAKNPFNTHPDFVKRSEELVAYINSKKEFRDIAVLQDWVRFEDRADWYLDSDLVVVINKLGDENTLAWRTRLVDFMWAHLPIATNGGDPLGEYIIEKQAAARISGLDKATLAEDMLNVLKDTKQMADLRKNLTRLKAEFYWDVVTRKLTDHIASHKRSADLEKYGHIEVMQQQGTSSRGKLRKGVRKARMIPAYARKYGAVNTYHALRTTAGNQVAKIKRKTGRAADRSKTNVVFIAHQLDMSGAPFVFIDLIENFVNSHPKVPINFHTFNPAHGDNIRRLNKVGIKPKIHLSRDIGLDFAPGDIAVVNTVGHSNALKDSVYSALEQGKLKHLVWYIHEDEPQLIFGVGEKKRIKQLLDNKKITIFAAAIQTVAHYQEFFENTTQIRLQIYKFITAKRFHKVRRPSDFDKLSFMLPGTVGDGRKGQMPVFYAFKAFLEQHYEKNPDAYRDFELVYIGLSDDFLSRQILRHTQALGTRFKHYGKVTHDRCLDLVLQSNMTICYSLRECLPLFVFEGMTAGHPILRNDCSGMEEQLEDGKNGFYLDSKDFGQVVATIEKTLNRQKTSNETLAQMSQRSYDIAKQQESNSYDPMLDAIKDAFQS